MATSARADEKAHQHESHADHILMGYLKVADALANDNLDDAKEAAAKIADLDKESSSAPAAGALAKSSSLEEARDHFKALSKAAISLAGDKEGYHVIACPMVKDGQWLQKDTTVKNPYKGQKMLGCGNVKS
ncbi:MAG: DUF3347 domain-containing protein [Verrucomicrobiales bacterium]